jgi:hypothetical protein
MATERSIFAAQEAEKSTNEAGEAACGLCGKKFRDESYLDRHMDNKHADHLARPDVRRGGARSAGMGVGGDSGC